MTKKKSTDIRKKEIVDISRELLARHGIAALTTKNLSQRMKISEAALYRHFKNKRAIIMALIEDFEVNLIEGVNNAMVLKLNPMDQLKEIMRVHMLLSERKKGVFFSITAESIHFKDKVLTSKVLEVIKRYKLRINAILQKAKDENLIRVDVDLDTTSLAFFGLIQTCIILYSLSNYTVFPITKKDILWDIFYRGIKS